MQKQKLIHILATLTLATAVLGSTGRGAAQASSSPPATPETPQAAGDGISFETPLNVLRTADHTAFGITQLSKGDFNGDGKLDLVGTGNRQRTSELDNGFVYLSLGNGDGSFQGAAQLRPLSVLSRGYPTDPGTYCPIARDFNGDGKLDIATAANTLKTVVVMLGRGDGSFKPQVITSTFPYNVNCINAADLNGDGVLDMVARSSDNTNKKIMVAFGAGNGGFQAPVSYDTHSALNSVSLGDVNNDGKVDIVYHGYGELKFGLMLNNGSGAFPAAPQQISIGGMTMMWFALADYTGDGKLDVLATGSSCNLGGPTCFYGVLVQGNGNGTFQTPPAGNYIDSLLNSDALVASGDNTPPDLNGDGKPDVVIISAANGENSVTTLISAGSGFTNRQRWIASSGTSRATLALDGVSLKSFVAGDFSGDGIADIAIGRAAYETPGGISLILGKGNGDFASPRMVEDGFALGSNNRTVALEDFTGDGKLDLLNISTGTPVLQPGLGNGTFMTSGLTTAPGGPGGTALTVSDINGDGARDVVFRGNSTQPVVVAINNGGGTFSTSSFRNPGTSQYSNQTQALGDFNGDGKLDLALRNAAGVEVFLYPFPTNPAIVSTPFVTLTLTPIASIDSSGNPPTQDLYAGDLDGDGKGDLLTHSINGTNDNLEFFKGQGNGTFAAAFSVGSGYGQTINMFLRDLDADGKLDLLAAGLSIWFAKGLGDGSFLAPAKIADNYGGEQTQLADFNSDGKPDIVTMYSSRGWGIRVFAGRGDGSFGPPIYLPQGSTGLTGVLAGDVNNDGKPDIIPVYYGFGNSRFINPVLLNTSGPHADLVMDMKASRASVTTNTSVRFIATITNTGGSTAPTVTLRSLLPTSAWTVESAVASQGNCANASGVVSCVVGNMPFSTTQVVTITAQPIVDGQLAATASVGSGLADPDLGDNGAAATVLVATAPTWVSGGAGGGGSIATATGSVSTNTNGKPVVRMARVKRSPVKVSFKMNKLNLPGVNSTNVKTTIIKVRIRYSIGYEMVETVISETESNWDYTIPGEDLVDGPVIIDVIVCGTACGDGDDIFDEWPWFEVELYDPSGIVSDRATGKVIENATVTLYKVPGALPDEGSVTKQCRTINTRPGGTGGNWDSLPAANPASGVLPDLLFDPGEISPVINPQKTNSIGYYGWDVAKGCWFVKVEATGYKTVISPLVGVPPAVLDLNIKMDKQGVRVFLPLLRK